MKHTQGGTYVHRDALPASWRPLVARAAMLAGVATEDIDVVKRQGDRVSLLRYPGFHTQDYPELAESWSVDVHRGTVRHRAYGGDTAPVLHRKELLLPEAPDAPRWSATTARDEARGCYRDPARIGRRGAWASACPRGNPADGTSTANLPRIHRRLLERGVWRHGDVNLDLGGGVYDVATRALARHGVRNLVLDPALGAEHNRAVERELRARPADTVTVANVLNVVRDPRERRAVLEQARALVKRGGLVVFQTYQREGDGRGRRTTRGWQSNRSTASYLPEIREVFEDVETWRDPGGLIVVGRRA